MNEAFDFNALDSSSPPTCTYQLFFEGHDDALLVGEVGDAVGEGDDEARVHLAPDDVSDGD